MPAPPTLRDAILAPWQTSNRVTIYLVEHLPAELWQSALPGSPRRTIRMLAAHLHNARCMWLKTLAQPHGIAVPRNVDRLTVSPAELIPALAQSGEAMLNLLKFGCDRGGAVPATPAYVWRNLPLDVGHVLAYFIAHEAHHRGQIVMLARRLGHRLPPDVTAGLWQWTKRSRET
jgi:uncharacterized damage-inducible protein DinB